MALTTRFSTWKPRIAGIALALTVGLTGTIAAAQGDASPSPMAAEITCAVADETGTPAASPEVAATPVSEELTGEEVTDEAIIAQLTDVATTCNPDAGSGISDVVVTEYGDNLYGIDYQYMSGRQLFRVLEMYSVESDTWTLRQQKQESPQTDEDTITISAKIGGGPGIEASPGSFDLVPAMRITVENRDSADLGLAVFSTTGEVDTESLVGQDVAALPDTMELQGETVVPAGTTGEMLFQGLGEGDYLLVALDAGDSVIGAAPLTINPPLDVGV